MALSTSARYDHTEGTVARTIEEQTAKLPSDTFLWAAGASIAASATLQLLGTYTADSRALQQARETAWLRLHRPSERELRWRAGGRTCEHASGGKNESRARETVRTH